MLDIATHESNLNQIAESLKIEGVDQAKLSLIIQSLRDNYTEVNDTISTSTTSIEKMKETNEGLRSANMFMLSKLGSQVDIDVTKDEKKKEIETVPSLDDIANKFIK